MQQLIVSSVICMLVIFGWGTMSIGAHQQELLRQMERHTHDQAYCLFLYNPIKLYVVSKAVEFVPYVTTTLNLAETSVTEQHWPVREGLRASG